VRSGCVQTEQQAAAEAHGRGLPAQPQPRPHACCAAALTRACARATHSPRAARTCSVSRLLGWQKLWMLPALAIFMKCSPVRPLR
jgi:phytoene/squalene synthetase